MLVILSKALVVGLKRVLDSRASDSILDQTGRDRVQLLVLLDDDAISLALGTHVHFEHARECHVVLILQIGLTTKHLVLERLHILRIADCIRQFRLIGSLELVESATVGLSWRQVERRLDLRIRTHFPLLGPATGRRLSHAAAILVRIHVLRCIAYLIESRPVHDGGVLHLQLRMVVGGLRGQPLCLHLLKDLVRVERRHGQATAVASRVWRSDTMLIGV